MNTILTEKDYQKFIIQRLVENGYVVRKATDYDRRFAMDPDMLFKFLEATPPLSLLLHYLAEGGAVGCDDAKHIDAGGLVDEVDGGLV